MKVCLIEVTYMAGNERAGSSRGPDRYLVAGVAELLAANRLAVRTSRVERGESFRDTVSACSPSAAIWRWSSARPSPPVSTRPVSQRSPDRQCETRRHGAGPTAKLCCRREQRRG